MSARWFLLMASVLGACNAHRATNAAPFPGIHWEHADPASAGFSKEGLQAARSYLKQLPTTGLMVVAHGKVILQDGDVQELSYIASVRKGVLGMLYGNEVAQGRIHLDDTVATLGIDDVGGLTTEEKEATVADLLASRSGVFHPAAASGNQEKDEPPRGSQKHGTYFVYNNWDFNVLGAIFEKASGKDVYDALRDDLAIPIGMEDFRRDAQKKAESPDKSIYPAYHMWLSTRDMARLGYLMLRDGDWAGRQLVPRDWVKQLTTITTPLEELHPERSRQGRLAYGDLWWILDDARSRAGGPLQGAYTAWGAYGQYITIIPKLDLVIANKSVPPSDGNDRSEMTDYLSFVDLIVASAHQVELPRHPLSEEGSLKSTSGPQTLIRFENRTPQPLTLYWLDRAGQRKSYGEIAPAGTKEMITFATHPWLVTDPQGKGLALAVAEPEEEGVVAVTDAP